jgi:hypothetical protein
MILRNEIVDRYARLVTSEGWQPPFAVDDA